MYTRNLSITKIKQYALEVFLAGYCTVILSVFLGGLFLLIIGQRRMLSARHWIDPPYSALPIFIAIACAFIFRRLTHRQPSVWVWVLPAIILAWNLFTWDRYPGQIYYWKDAWNNYFGSECGSSECLYELAVTGPFCCSVAYSIVAIFFRFRRSPKLLTGARS